MTYKPKDYNSLSPYLIINGAQKLVDLLKNIFNAKELRRFNHDDGSIQHTELRIDDSIIMLSDSTTEYSANISTLHVYVGNVFETYKLAMENGCISVEEPINKQGDPDIRGSFKDFAGNYWAIGQQIN